MYIVVRYFVHFLHTSGTDEYFQSVLHSSIRISPTDTYGERNFIYDYNKYELITVLSSHGFVIYISYKNKTQIAFYSFDKIKINGPFELTAYCLRGIISAYRSRTTTDGRREISLEKPRALCNTALSENRPPPRQRRRYDSGAGQIKSRRRQSSGPKTELTT